MQIKLVGADELKKAFQDLPKRIGRDVLRRALRKAAEPIAEDARRRAPVADGELRDAIIVSTQLSKRQRRYLRKRKTPLLGVSGGDINMYVGASPARHAHLIEYGTGPRYHKNGKYVGQTPPQPFMRPAWESGKNQALATLLGEMKVELDKAIQRVARKRAKA